MFVVVVVIPIIVGFLSYQFGFVAGYGEGYESGKSVATLIR